MNYRHAYHAGNFADVLKHIVLTRIISHLKLKDKAFRVIDTHAGAGRYDLDGAEAQKTGEWRFGIGRLLGAELPGEIAPLVDDYLGLMACDDNHNLLSFYPGSPLIIRQCLRKCDRLSVTELHPEEFARLHNLFAGDYQVRVNQLDGWLALGAHLPPKEKRGMVLVDPPFEQKGEFERLTTGLKKAHKRWPGGTYCLWYPVKQQKETADFVGQIAELKLAKTLRVELSICGYNADSTALVGCGLILVNPPFTLEAELQILLPWLSRLLARDDGASSKIEWLVA